MPVAFAIAYSKTASYLKPVAKSLYNNNNNTNNNNTNNNNTNNNNTNNNNNNNNSNFINSYCAIININFQLRIMILIQEM